MVKAVNVRQFGQQLTCGFVTDARDRCQQVILLFEVGMPVNMFIDTGPPVWQFAHRGRLGYRADFPAQPHTPDPI